MKPLRLIDITVHELSGPQLLEQVLIHFRQSTKDPVTLMARRGEGAEIIHRLRAELSRSRKDYKAAGRVSHQFGFISEGPLSVHINGISMECYAIVYRITKLQQMKNFANFGNYELELSLG